MNEAAAIKYTCNLMNQKLAIGIKVIDARRLPTPSEKAKIELINERLQRVRNFQIVRNSNNK